LTKADYNNVKRIVKLTNLFNKIIPEKDVPDDELFKGTVNMDGTGKIDIEFDKKL
jgi:hypothetical protein